VPEEEMEVLEADELLETDVAGQDTLAADGQEALLEDEVEILDEDELTEVEEIDEEALEADEEALVPEDEVEILDEDELTEAEGIGEEALEADEGASVPEEVAVPDTDELLETDAAGQDTLAADGREALLEDEVEILDETELVGTDEDAEGDGIAELGADDDAILGDEGEGSEEVEVAEDIADGMDIMDDARIVDDVDVVDGEDIVEDVDDEMELVDETDIEEELADEGELEVADDGTVISDEELAAGEPVDEDSLEEGEVEPETPVDEIVDDIAELTDDEILSEDEVVDETIPDGASSGEDGEGSAVGEAAAEESPPAAPEPPGVDWMQEVGLPLDLFDGEEIDLDKLMGDPDRKKELSARFDGFLGVMERYYNQFIMVPKGRYRVGGRNAAEDEMDLRDVSLDAFLFSKFPVTNAIFEIFVDRTGYVTSAEKLGFGYVYRGRFRREVDEKTGRVRSLWNPVNKREKVRGATWFQPLGPGSNLHNRRNHPVVQVSFRDAMSFAAWTGKRLPTEAEWEAAARTRDARHLPWGNQWVEGACNDEARGISDTTAVDRFESGQNPLGIFDLLGNVMEWTMDTCRPRYERPHSAVTYIAKGGGWIADSSLTLLSRHRLAVDFSSNILGFRCLAD
jgi:formylglycine-generating enzyme required for sulfatase activity